MIVRWNALIGVLLSAVALTVVSSVVAHAQVGGGSTPAPTLSHELLIASAGAAFGVVFGGLFGPIFQAVDAAFGIFPGARAMRENYEVQKQIAASLRQLVDAQLATPQPIAMERHFRRRGRMMAPIVCVALVATGILAVLIGLLWIGRGTGLFPYPADSSMINQRPWVWDGALATAIGAGAISAAAMRAACHRYE